MPCPWGQRILECFILFIPHHVASICIYLTRCALGEPGPPPRTTHNPIVMGKISNRNHISCLDAFPTYDSSCFYIGYVFSLLNVTVIYWIIRCMRCKMLSADLRQGQHSRNVHGSEIKFPGPPQNLTGPSLAHAAPVSISFHGNHFSLNTHNIT